MGTPAELMLRLSGTNAERLALLTTHLERANQRFTDRGFATATQLGIGLIPSQFYSYYPLLFEPVFPDLNPSVYVELTCGSHFLSLWCFVTDHLMDRTHSLEAGRLLMAGLFPEEARRYFEAILPPASAEFWRDYEAFQREFVTGMIAEGQHHPAYAPIATVAEASAIGRAACAKIVPAAMAHLSGVYEILPALIRSHDKFALGRQLLDDLEDWSDDLQRGQGTYLLQSAMHRAGTRQEARLREVIATELRPEHLTWAHQSFVEAEEEVRGLTDCGWLRWIGELRTNVERQLELHVGHRTGEERVR